jgi:hypothetical protein
MIIEKAGKLPITGHKDPRMLMRYTHLRVEGLVKRLDQSHAKEGYDVITFTS